MRDFTMLLMREAFSCALIHRQTVADGARSAAPIGGGRRQAVAGAARLAIVVAFVVCALPLSAAGQATDAESGETKPALEELAPASSPTPESGAIEPQSAIAGGANFGIGFQVPVGQRRGVIGDNEIGGSADLSLSFLLRFGESIQWDFLGVRGGFAGLDTELYEGVFGFEDMDTRHVWFGTHLRATPFRGPVRPFASFSLGADRVVATYSEGTGTYECENSGFVQNCVEIGEERFRIGYWGLATGFGGGVHVLRIKKPFGLIVEVQGNRIRYGRLTSSAFENQRLRQDSPVIWNVSTLVLLQLSG